MHAHGNVESARHAFHQLRFAGAEFTGQREDQPRCAARPQASPSDSVSAGLWEMNVAMVIERARAVFIANRDAAAGDNLPDAT